MKSLVLIFCLAFQNLSVLASSKIAPEEVVQTETILSEMLEETNVDSSQLAKLLERRLKIENDEEIILVEKSNTDPILLVQEIFDIEIQLQSLNMKLQAPLVNIDQNLKDYLQLLKIYNDYINMSIKVGEIVQKKIKNEEALSGDDLYYIKKTISLFYFISKKLLTFAEVHEIKNLDLAGRIAARDSKDPLIKSQLIYMSGMLLILDHFLEIYPVYYGDGSLRRIVKNIFKNQESDLGNNKNFEDLISLLKEVIKTTKEKKFKNQLFLIKSSYKDLTEILDDSEEAVVLVDKISGNKRLPEIIDGTLDIPNKRYKFVDSIISIFSQFTDTLSKIFGNFSGSIKWRDGSLFKNHTAHLEMVSSLKPMDILLEKTPFALTDKFIPGHFGHAALYLGTKEQLIEIGVWDHPSIQPYKHEIEKGKVILEAVRPGVRLTTLEEFMQIDEIAVIRKNDVLKNADDLYEVVLRGMLQIGKDYDFNFDVETLDKIVCSELIYLVFGNVVWPTKYQLMRNTISPDNIGEILYFLKSKFELKTYFNAEKSKSLNHMTKFDLAPKLGFSEDGKDEAGADIFAKKSTKCYTSIGTTENDSTSQIRRSCRVTKRRYVYQERNFELNY